MSNSRKSFSSSFTKINIDPVTSPRTHARMHEHARTYSLVHAHTNTPPLLYGMMCSYNIKYTKFLYLVVLGGNGCMLKSVFM